MALKDRKRKKRLIRGGIIRLGHKEKKNGYEYPVQDDHFQLHDAPAILASYGPEQDGKDERLRQPLPAWIYRDWPPMGMRRGY